METENSFHIVDYFVFGFALLSSLGVGLYHSLKGGKPKSNREYLVGSREFSLLPVAISIIVTIISASGLLGTPAEVYTFGTQYFLHVLGAALGNIIALLTFVPLFYPLKLTSIFEYLELRFRSKGTRLMANVTTLLTQVLFNSIGIVAPAFALQAVTGVPVWGYIMICGIIATIYTSLGGMKAVIWTDVVQSLFIFSGLITLTIVGTVKVGGLSRVWNYNSQWERIEFFNWNPDPTVRLSFWSVVFCLAALYVCLASNQPSVQRYCTLPTIKHAKRSLLLNIVGLSMGGILACLVGMVAFAYYAKMECDPLRSGKLRNPNQILPYFVLDVLKYPGLSGLFTACIVCAALSTASSSMNASAAMVWQDLLSRIQPFKSMSETNKTRTSKSLVVVVGMISMVTAFLLKDMKGTFVQIVLSVAGSILGPTTGLFFLGGVNPRAGSKAGMIAVSMALCWSAVLNIGAQVNRVHTTPLPSPTSGCDMAEDSGMTLLSNLTLPMPLSEEFTSPYHPEARLAIDNDTMLEGVAHILKMSETSDTGPVGRRLKLIFSLSHLYYPLIGVLTVIVFGSLLSIIPAFRHNHFVPDEHLFPFTVYLRNKFCGCVPQIEKAGMDHNAACNIEPLLIKLGKTVSNTETMMSQC